MSAAADAVDPARSADAQDPAEAVVEAVMSCPGVVRMATGSPVEIATYLPGRRVHGVRIGDGVVEVHVVARPGTVLPELADSVRRAVATVVPTSAVDVYVDDLDIEPEDGAVDPRSGRAVPR